MDWAQWHDLYDASPALIARLRIVRLHITRCLDTFPSGMIRVLSICAGDGRDLIPVLTDHGRVRDVHARLIELDPRLVECGRAMADAAGLADQVEIVAGDATAVAAYRDFAPADLVLACGVFGNVRKADTARLAESLASLCARGGFLIWTRRVGGRLHSPYGRRAPGGNVADPANILGLLRDRSFEDVQVDHTPDGTFVVATCQHRGEAPPLPSDERPLFVFTGAIGPQG